MIRWRSFCLASVLIVTTLAAALSSPVASEGRRLPLPDISTDKRGNLGNKMMCQIDYRNCYDEFLKRSENRKEKIMTNRAKNSIEFWKLWKLYFEKNNLYRSAVAESTTQALHDKPALTSGDILTLLTYEHMMRQLQSDQDNPLSADV